MKRLILLLCLIMFGIANADFLGVKQASETISFFIKEPIDSAYGIPRLPDSVHIMTYADNASAATFQTRSTTYPFSDVSIDTLKIYGDTLYVFADQIQDIDGAGGNFELAILVKMFTNGYYLETHNTVQVISDSLENMLDASKDSSSSAAILSKNNLDSLQAQDDWVAQEATLAYFDSLIYDGPRGPGVYLDSAAGNTNTVLGTDGTAKNPVSTIAAAKTLATALGYNRYYFINASTFNDAANDIPSSHQNWEFIGIANSNALAFGTQRVDESRFENMDLSGTMHASGGNVLYTNCTLGYITANFNGHAFNCLLADTIVVKADQDIEFVRCQSDVGGNQTPTIDLSGGSSVVQIRGYSGGIRIMNGASNDTISIEADGQVIISANNTSLNITLRGMMSRTDSGTTTNLTEDAVFNRTDVPPLIADSTWLADFEAHDGVAGSFGDSAQGWGATSASALDSGVVSRINHRVGWGTPQGSGSDSSTSSQRDIGAVNAGAISSGSFVTGAVDANAIATAAIGAPEIAANAIGSSEFADGTLSLAKFDSTVIAILTEGIWLDAAAANTNSTVGIDGTITNPVSTLAAARILADSQSLQQYYLINNSSFTLDATYENWTFLGIGRGNSINFGSQDTDNSDFYNLMITGTQGGTGVVLLDKCYLNTPDSLEALVTRSSLSDTISLRVSTATVFDQCYSNIAGNTTPGLDFNSAGTIEVSFRHYSGGITLFNMTSTHTISYEAIGQLVIDATCTSANVTARGLMNIADNGTTTALIDTAVINTTQNIGINWADIDNKTSIVDLTQTLINTSQKVDLNTAELHKIWSPTYSPLIIEKAAAITDGSNTTITFKTSLPVATDDWYNGQQMVFRYATSPDSIKVINIVDHTGSDSFVVIRDGLPTAPASGDSIWVLTARTAVEPLTLANIKLALTATGHAGLDYANVNSQLDGEDFTDAYWDSIAARSDSGATASISDADKGDIADSIWNKPFATAFPAGSMGDSLNNSSYVQGPAAGLDTTQIKRMIYNNFRIMPENKKVRFIDDDGSDADGLTPATAWTDFSKVEDSTGYTFYVFPGTYADAVCKITKSNVDIISVEPMGATLLRNADDTLKANTIIQLNPDQDEGIITNIRIIGFNFAYKVSYTTTPPDPSFQAAIWAFDSVSYVEIANNFFVPDSNYKSISVEDVETKYFYIHDNHFVKNYTHAMDFAGDYSIIENNTIVDQRGYLGGASGANTTEPIQITTKGEHNVIRGNYINYGSVLVRLQGDNNLVANNYLGYSVANDGRWIEGYAVGADTAQQNVAAGNWSRAFTPDTSGAGSGLDSLSTVNEDLENIYNKTNAYTGGDGEFACSLLVYDGSTFISPANVRMTSGVQTFTVNVSADGWAVFALDGGTWTALVTALRYVQDTIPQTFTFSADLVDTLTMTTFSPSTPTDTGKVMLYVWTDSTFGATYAGATFRVIPLDKGKNWVSGGGRVIPLGELTKTTDSTGYAEIEVYQSSFTHPYPSGSDSLKYNISITYPGLSSWAQFRFVAPDSGSQYQIGVR